MPSNWTRPRWLPSVGRAGLLALVVALLLSFAVAGQEFVKKSLATPGDAVPISLSADHIATWNDAGQRVFLLSGSVWIEQGLNKISARESVVWVDEAGKTSSGIYRLLVYGEGGTDLKEASQQTVAARVLLDMATRGELRIKAQKQEVVQSKQDQDRIFLNAQNQRRIALEKPGEAAAQTNSPQVLQQTNHQAAPVAPSSAGTVSDPPATPPSSVVPVAQVVTPPPQTINEIPPPTPQRSPGAGLPVPFVPKEAIAAGPARQVNIRPRSGQEIQARTFSLPNGETAWVVTSGVILTISNATADVGIVDIEADRLVFWTKDKSQDLFNNMRGSGQTSDSQALEFYLSGNVEIRNQNKKTTQIVPGSVAQVKEEQIIRADEVFYNVGRNTAVALKADLELHDPKLPYPLHIVTEELNQLGPKLFKASRTEVFASELPSDPGLKVVVGQSELEELDTPRRNIFGIQFRDPGTGPIDEPQRIFRGRNTVIRLGEVPIFYLPYVQGDPQDPLGPLEEVNVNYNRIFGFQAMSTWNIYDLLGIRPIKGTRLLLNADYLSARGPALGVEFSSVSRPWLGFGSGINETWIRAYGILDQGNDILGGNPDRGTFNVIQEIPAPIILPMTHPYARGRITSRTNVQGLPNDWMFQGQISVLSDKNFLEQYFNKEFNNDINQDTFLYGKQQRDNWAWSVYGEARIRNWVTETSWFPKLDGYLLGEKFFDIFTYNAHGSAGMAQLLPTHQPPFAYLPTDVFVNTPRLDLWQDVSLPFSLGAFNLVPYGILDLTYYSEDVNKNDIGRILGGGGLRASLPVSRLYPGIQSDMFNLNGIFHKIVFSANYYNVYSNTAINQLPQLDRLNDDTTDQALRDIRPRQPSLNPANALNLMNSPEFNPQFYALRRLVDNRVDSLQFLDVLQLNTRQRWQTKRGFPGNQHIIDWMVLDLGASIFPQANRDNFGETFGILYYDWIWNVGDSTSLVSNGWMDPIAGGPRVFNIGANLMRPDRTNLYLGYRELDPLNSKAVVANVTYAMSAKYALTGSTFYDFGVNTQVTTIGVSRIGTDLTVNLGFSYNSILNNFSVNFIILPNLIARSNPAALAGSPMIGGPGGGGPFSR